MWFEECYGSKLAATRLAVTLDTGDARAVLLWMVQEMLQTQVFEDLPGRKAGYK